MTVCERGHFLCAKCVSDIKASPVPATCHKCRKPMLDRTIPNRGMMESMGIEVVEVPCPPETDTTPVPETLAVTLPVSDQVKQLLREPLSEAAIRALTDLVKTDSEARETFLRLGISSLFKPVDESDRRRVLRDAMNLLNTIKDDSRVKEELSSEMMRTLLIDEFFDFEVGGDRTALYELFQDLNFDEEFMLVLFPVVYHDRWEPMLHSLGGKDTIPILKVLRSMVTQNPEWVYCFAWEEFWYDVLRLANTTDLETIIIVLEIAEHVISYLPSRHENVSKRERFRLRIRELSRTENDLLFKAVVRFVCNAREWQKRYLPRDYIDDTTSFLSKMACLDDSWLLCILTFVENMLTKVRLVGLCLVDVYHNLKGSGMLKRLMREFVKSRPWNEYRILARVVIVLKSFLGESMINVDVGPQVGKVFRDCFVDTRDVYEFMKDMVAVTRATGDSCSIVQSVWHSVVDVCCTLERDLQQCAMKALETSGALDVMSDYKFVETVLDGKLDTSIPEVRRIGCKMIRTVNIEPRSAYWRVPVRTVSLLCNWDKDGTKSSPEEVALVRDTIVGLFFNEELTEKFFRDNDLTPMWLLLKRWTAERSRLDFVMNLFRWSPKLREFLKADKVFFDDITSLWETGVVPEDLVKKLGYKPPKNKADAGKCTVM